MWEATVKLSYVGKTNKKQDVKCRAEQKDKMNKI